MAAATLKPRSQPSSYFARFCGIYAQGLEAIRNAQSMQQSAAVLDDLDRQLIEKFQDLLASVDEGHDELDRLDRVPFGSLTPADLALRNRLEVQVTRSVLECVPAVLEMLEHMRQTPEVQAFRTKAGRYLEEAQLDSLTDQELFAGTPERADVMANFIEDAMNEADAGLTESLLPLS